VPFREELGDCGVAALLFGENFSTSAVANSRVASDGSGGAVVNVPSVVVPSGAFDNEVLILPLWLRTAHGHVDVGLEIMMGGTFTRPSAQ